MASFHGLIDCNNFFVSCERLMHPDLNGRAVVVLSNNDGCAISRSNEAKTLGIPMGCPAFKIKECTKEPVVAISGNHRLYADISHRIMYLLGREVENISVYSVDEAFFEINGATAEEAYRQSASLCARIRHDIGIPVSVGIAQTKTLAKIASHIAKTQKTYMGNTHMLIDPLERDRVLRLTPIGDVWGIGRRIKAGLSRYAVRTAYDFVQLPDSLIQSQYSITTLRVKRELLGESCAEISPIDRAKQSIMTSHSFGNLVTDKRELADAIVNFASRCCTLLRQQNSVADTVEVHIRGDYNKPQLPFYANSCALKLPFATCNTLEIVNSSLTALDNIYRSNFTYKKAGVLLTGISDADSQQPDLFHSADEARNAKLMKAIDRINTTSGGGTIGLASSRTDGCWTPRHEHCPKPSSTLHIYTGMLLPEDL